MARKESKGKSPERRAEIIDAFYRCIAKRGYSSTSVRDIAAEANIKASAIYYYFENKDDILYTLADHILDSYRRQFQNFLQREQHKPPGERLTLGIQFLFTKIAGDRDLIEVFYELFNLARHDERLRRSLRRLYRRYREEVAEFILKCVRGSNLSAETARSLAAFMVSASEGVSEQWNLDPKGIRLSTMADMAGRFVEYAVDAGNM